jgi:hypothetical protein
MDPPKTAAEAVQQYRAGNQQMPWEVRRDADAAIAALEEENKRLQCCPNCSRKQRYNEGTGDEFTECPLVRKLEWKDMRDDWDYMDGVCYFTPSRWEG